ncbi:OGG1 [[Candida] subhashii]|uniref:N-glycosylase/DNA lyase n=1 Tax=[Candida] subhashii TaxID=561895 RepID=A0A8J5QN27_9ASCO|nr:OGG1 [[Candida] subhashii]KAG7663360.1 OGG1 [[Candida] subhashii]
MTIETVWKKFPIRETELSLSKVLRCGQTFRWKNINNIWSFTTNDRIILLKQDPDHIHYSHIMREGTTGSDSETFEFINDYFTLPINLSQLYTHWKFQHEKFKTPTKISPFDTFTGIRILRQDPWECLISFICSSNNNVKRISQMCDKLCVNFGKYINTYQDHEYYSFPSPKELSALDVESKLRELGFGYRAKYIHKTALQFVNDPNITLDKLMELRESDHQTAHDFLLQLTGVGPKVADCICLMSLDKHDTVPIDTHVYQIAIRDYKFKGKKDMKTLNKTTYVAIREFFKDIFGDYAGWAQSVLFAADLADLNNGTNIKVEDEIEVETKIRLKKSRTGIELKEASRKRIKVEA